MLKLVDGINYVKYDMNKLLKMYTYLDNVGELYFIEILENNIYIPIGDVTFCKDDMPIVIGDSSYRGKGIGKLVIQALIDRAKNLGYDDIFVREIYTYNVHSQNLFENVGFEKYNAT